MAGETQPGVGTVGARLRAAREAKRLSVHAIATTTKIPVGALDALEEDDAARLPSGIFSRGFVRSYAAAVGLNPEQTVRDFVAQLPAPEHAMDAVSTDRPHGYHHSPRQWLVAGLVLGGVLVCSAGAAFLFVVGIPGLPTRPDTPPVPAVAMAPEPALAPRLAVPVRERPSPTIEPVPQAPLTLVLRPRGRLLGLAQDRRRDGGAARHARWRAGNLWGARRDYPERRGRRGVRVCDQPARRPGARSLGPSHDRAPDAAELRRLRRTVMRRWCTNTGRWCTTLRLRRGSCRLSGHGDRCGCTIST